MERNTTDSYGHLYVLCEWLPFVNSLLLFTILVVFVVTFWTDSRRNDLKSCEAIQKVSPSHYDSVTDKTEPSNETETSSFAGMRKEKCPDTFSVFLATLVGKKPMTFPNYLCREQNNHLEQQFMPTEDIPKITFIISVLFGPAFVFKSDCIKILSRRNK